MSWELLLSLGVLFGVKVLDGLLGTGKTLLLQRGYGFLSAITVALTQWIFYLLLDAVLSADGSLQKTVIIIGSGVGTYLAVKIGDMCSKEVTYETIILSNDLEAMRELRDFLASKKITNHATDGYTLEWEHTLIVTVFAETVEQREVLDKYLTEKGVKCKKVITKKRVEIEKMRKTEK